MITEDYIKSIDVVLSPIGIYLLSENPPCRYGLPYSPTVDVIVDSDRCPYCGCGIAGCTAPGMDGGSWQYGVYLCGSMAATRWNSVLGPRDNVLLAISKPTAVCSETAAYESDNTI